METSGAARSDQGGDDDALDERETTERELARAREAYVLRLARFGLLQPALGTNARPAPETPRVEADPAAGR